MKAAAHSARPAVPGGIHPLVKIAFASVVWLTAFSTDDPWMLAAILAALFGILACGKNLFFVLRLLVVSMSFFALFLYLFQGFFGGGDSTVLLRIGPFAYRSLGVLYATSILLRLLIFVSALLLVFLSQRPRVLIDSLLAAGLPSSLGFLILATLQLAPRTQLTLHRISEAQQMRGLVRQGSLLRRIRSFIPLLGPLVLSQLRQVEEQSLALEERGFGHPGRRTLRYAVPLQTVDRWALVLAGLTLLLLLLRFGSEVI
jgi:energy-coupling factor transport system permease protein